MQTSNMFVVTYETSNSVICEYMTEMKFNNLKKDELNGNIRIMNHRILNSVM